MKIFKFPIELTDRQTVEMQKGAHILSCQEQKGVLTIWAIVDPNAEKVERNIAIVGTGRADYPDTPRTKFIATVQQGDFVWHIFDMGEVSE